MSDIWAVYKVDKVGRMEIYLNVVRPFRAFIRDIDRPPEKCYSVAAIEPSLKIKVAT